jgi:hypothetical protein
MTSFTNNNYSLANIVTVSDALLNVLPLGHYKYSDGFVLTNTGPIYILMNDTKIYINSMEQFAAFGFDAGDIISSSAADVASYTTGSVLSQLFVIGSQSYFMDRGTVWSISDTIKSHYGVSVSTPSYTTPVISGKPVQTATRFIKSTSSPNVYYLENGQKRHLLSWDAIVARGGSAQTIMTMSDYSLTVFTSGPSI